MSQSCFFSESIGKKTENEASIKLIKLASQMHCYKMLSAEQLVVLVCDIRF